MKVNNGIEMLELHTVVMGKETTIYPVLLWDKDMAILIDTGYPNLLENLRVAITSGGVPFEALQKIIITHHDIDHIGSLSSIVKEFHGDLEVLAHKEEKPYIEGDRTAVKLAKLEANLANLPDGMKLVYEKFKTFYKNNKIPVNSTLQDGEELNYCGGLKVIFTPGHTPGHICLYHMDSKTLIAGDALGVEAGKLIKTSPSTDFDEKLAVESLKKLLNLDIKTIICYHGGLYEGNINQDISELINGV
jgi:glyoxylase-like metal-dependent hydrolase (beta-lactamase superfamily II)